MVKSIRLFLGSVLHFVGRTKWSVRIVVLLAIFAVFSGGAIVVTSQTGFCNSCHIMNKYYASWEVSDHNDVNCLDCHLQPGFTGYVLGKINGLAQAVDCMVGRVSTKPSATVLDASCLRSECHSSEKLKTEVYDYNGVQFSHDKHIDKTVGGMKISCRTCHSHFEGNKHFSVNRNACFSCHFLSDKASGRPLVKTECRSCHEVPKEIIRRGFVTINHQEFVSYEASCEESCHKREVAQVSAVEDTVCQDCHDFSLGADVNSVELHASHTTGEKVECFACHGTVLHGQTRVASVSAMMDCRSCHSDTHQVQRTIYSTQNPTGGHEEDRVLSPMFLTHVECTDCHIERTRKTTGTLDSFGTVARAVPAACDRCHEAGTGQRYVPFWQKQIKALHARVTQKVDQAEALANARAGTERGADLLKRVQQARSVLDSIAADGSWGVHNFKYTEALLLEAEKKVSGED